MRRLRDGDPSLLLLAIQHCSTPFSVRRVSIPLLCHSVSQAGNDEKVFLLWYSHKLLPAQFRLTGKLSDGVMDKTELRTPLSQHQKRGTIERGGRRHEARSPPFGLTASQVKHAEEI